MATTISRAGCDEGPAVSMQEWRVRVELAALYRLVALQGWDDLIFTHISARVPGSEDHFLMNPAHLAFDEITASSLVKLDIDGNIIGGTGKEAINRAGYVIHSAIHAARPDAAYVIHIHTLDGMAVSCHPDGLLPLTQTALSVLPLLSYHDYEGVASDLDERERLVRDLGEGRVMILRNHGTLAIGATAGEAWLGIYFLERACSIQVRALGAGAPALHAPQAAQDKVAEMVNDGRGHEIYDVAWQAMLRRVARESPGFDD